MTQTATAQQGCSNSTSNKASNTSSGVAAGAQQQAGELRRWRVVSAGAALWLAWAGACFAQTAPGASTTPTVVPTPAELVPRAPIVTDPSQLPDARRLPRQLAEPEALTLQVRGYTVADDAPPALRAALERITAPYVGADKHFEDLINAADDVTRFLNRELGYYLAYAYIPEQTPQEGRVRIEIVEGRLDRVVLRWPDTPLPVRREVIDSYLAKLQPGAVLKVRDVERVVFLVNDLRGVAVRFDVQPGDRPGTSQLVVTPGVDPSPVGKVDVDTNGSRFLGSQRLGGLWAWNSPAGRGDALTVNGLVSSNGGLRFGLASYTLPLGSDGLKVGGSLSYIHYKLDESDFPLGVNGDAVAGGAFALYPWVRSRNLNVFVVGALNHTRATDRKDAAGVSDRRDLDSLTLGTTGDLRDGLLSGGVNSYEVNLTSGRVRYPDNRPAGLDDAASYRKLTLAFNRLQNLLTSRLLLYAALRSQKALSNLDTSEQFRLGGPDGVRAFAPGEGTGDSGWLLTAELRLVPPEAWVGRFARESVVSLFYDTGRVTFRHDPSQRPANFENTASFSGGGLALSWARGSDYALRMSLGWPTNGTPKSDPKERSPRLYLQFSKLL